MHKTIVVKVECLDDWISETVGNRRVAMDTKVNAFKAKRIHNINTISKSLAEYVSYMIMFHKVYVGENEYGSICGLLGCFRTSRGSENRVFSKDIEFYVSVALDQFYENCDNAKHNDMSSYYVNPSWNSSIDYPQGATEMKVDGGTVTISGMSIKEFTKSMFKHFVENTKPIERV